MCFNVFHESFKKKIGGAVKLLLSYSELKNLLQFQPTRSPLLHPLLHHCLTAGAKVVLLWL